ncbi:MAG: ParB N-terminal domain-containing protein [Erysipelotrichaceae bacterium]|nr:ParB N-terminal domain-containing protein [Erysipelotrichaceae bacterium]
MINKIVNINDIVFKEVEYGDELYDSILNRGVAIPIKVIKKDQKYECIDGNKRLSILKKLSKINKKFEKVYIMIVNDFSKSGSGFWGNTRNKH